MNLEQELRYLDDDSTNYMNGQMYNEFKWGMMHLEPFTSESGRPPMQSFDYIMMSETQFGLGERITETMNHIKEDFDLSNEMIKNKLCGFSVTTDNGWKVTFKNRRLAKQMDVPTP